MRQKRAKELRRLAVDAWVKLPASERKGWGSLRRFTRGIRKWWKRHGVVPDLPEGD